MLIYSLYNKGQPLQYNNSNWTTFNQNVTKVLNHILGLLVESSHQLWHTCSAFYAFTCWVNSTSFNVNFNIFVFYESSWNGSRITIYIQFLLLFEILLKWCWITFPNWDQIYMNFLRWVRKITAISLLDSLLKLIFFCIILVWIFRRCRS